MFDRVDILCGATAQELETVCGALCEAGIAAAVRPYKGAGLFARSKWLRMPGESRKFALSVRKRDVSKADYLLGRLMRQK